MKKQIMYVLLLGWLTACSKPKDQQTEEFMAIKASQVVTEQISSERCYSFISQPYKEAVLSFRVGGIVDEFNVQSGQFFKQGSRIASIDERDFIIQKDHAQALYEQATSEYNRVKILYTQNNISGSTYEKAKADYQITKANLETATNQWEDTQLTAPFDGYVQQVYIEKYQDVRPSQAIVSLMDLSKIKVEVYIPEEIAVQLRTKKDLPIQITFDGLPGEIFTPTEIFVSQNITTNNISFLLTAIIMNPGNRLFGGMSGTVSLSLGKEAEKHSTLVPQSAVCHRKEIGSFVWVVSPDQRVQQRRVKTGMLKENHLIEIKEGINPNEKVAVTGLSFLSDNQQVTIL